MAAIFDSETNAATPHLEKNSRRRARGFDRLLDKPQVGHIVTTMILSLKQTLALVTLATIFAAAPAMADWEKLPPLPEANGGMACGVADDSIIVVGGTNWADGEKLWLDSVRRFDVKKGQWQTLDSLPHAFAYGAFASPADRSDFLLLGGTDGGAPRKTLVSHSGKSATSTTADNLPDQIVLSTGGVVGDEFLIVGGTDDAANIAGMTTQTFSFDLEKKTVSPLPDYPGKPFAIAASAAVGKELFVFGGANWNAADETVPNTTDCFAFSVETKKWRKLKSFPLDVRGHTAVALDDHRIYLAGGYGGAPAGFLAKSFIYDISSDTYTEARPLPYAATAGLVILDGYLYCIGGEDQMKSRTDSFWRIAVEKL